MAEPDKKPLSSILFDSIENPPSHDSRKPRIDLDFELVLLRCAIGCLTQDIPMSSADYVRMYLAIARLSRG